MRNTYQLLLAFLSMTVSLMAQSKHAPAMIGDSAVWQLPAQFTGTAHAACDQSSSSDYADCMTGQMAKAGAPAAAVGFTRELYKESHGEFGVMTDFRTKDQLPLPGLHILCEPIPTTAYCC